MGLLVFGISPLIFAPGAGAVARQTIGFTVLGGMAGQRRTVLVFLLLNQ